MQRLIITVKINIFILHKVQQNYDILTEMIACLFKSIVAEVLRIRFVSKKKKKKNNVFPCVSSGISHYIQDIFLVVGDTMKIIHWAFIQ